MPGHQTMLSATITVSVPGPRIAAVSSAMITSGKAKTISTVRMMRPSAQPRTQAATMPSATPITMVIASTERATVSDTRAPKISRLKMSRPSASAPSR